MAIEIREITIRTAIQAAQNTRQSVAARLAQIAQLRARIVAECQRMLASGKRGDPPR